MSFERIELAERLPHISLLTERRLAMPAENDDARTLAERIPKNRLHAWPITGDPSLTKVGWTLSFGSIRDLMQNASDWAPRVLVVDDDESVRVFAVRVLERAGYDVRSAADGVDALRLVTEHAGFDLCVLDVTMPRMTGQELGRQIRAQYPDVKVLYFTGYSDQLFEEKPTLWQHEAFVEKPVSTTGFLEATSLLLFGHTQGLPKSE